MSLLSSIEPFPYTRFDDFELGDGPRWLVDELLPEVGLAVMHGHPGCGKSFIAIDLAVHVAGGQNWNGRTVEKGSVAYVAAEGWNGINARCVAAAQQLGVVAIPLSMISHSMDLQGGGDDPQRLIETVRKAEQEHGDATRLIIVDTLSQTFGDGKENSDDMARYVRNCQKIAQEVGCCVLVVHHRPKDAESKEPRGHSSLKAGADTVMLIEDRPRYQIKVQKLKEAKGGDVFRFALQQFVIDRGDHDAPVSTCIVSYSEGQDCVDPAAEMSRGRKQVFEALIKALADHGVTPPASLNVAPDIDQVVSEKQWRSTHQSGVGTSPDNKPDSIRKAFNRNRDALQSERYVCLLDGYAWLHPDRLGHHTDI